MTGIPGSPTPTTGDYRRAMPAPALGAPAGHSVYRPQPMVNGGMMGAPSGPMPMPRPTAPADIIGAQMRVNPVDALSASLGRPVEPADIMAILGRTPMQSQRQMPGAGAPMPMRVPPTVARY